MTDLPRSRVPRGGEFTATASPRALWAEIARRAPVVTDLIPALVLTGFLVGASTAQEHATGDAHRIGIGGYLLLVGAAMALALRRRWPPLAYAASLACTGTYLLVGDPPGPILLAPFLGLVVVLAATRSLQIWIVAVLGGACVLSAVHGAVYGWSWPVALFAAVWVCVAALAGIALDARRRFLRESRARAEWTQRSREEEARRRMVEERLRIAREMHDVIGHSLAVITLQAGVAEHLLASRPEEARKAITAIRGVSKQALTELRSELAALRGEGLGGVDRRPTPGLSALPALAAQMRDAGLQIDLELPERGDEVPEIVSTAAYRIVQESLTNVARHAGSGTRASVRAVLQPDRLDLEIVDDGTGVDEPPREGGGLQGMRERAAALAGTFSAGRRTEGGFRVWASLPLGRR
ncbi:MAG TPA: sensor histidine kinase [Candidatus Dormibacteraeota bacterium]|jgi:signal transduction histidine kinase|nr:sensor histidine kinase [Candidatus Dormibacteraeota bacterium]